LIRRQANHVRIEIADSARKHGVLDEDMGKDLAERAGQFKDKLATEYLLTTREVMRYGTVPEGWHADYDKGLGYLRRLLSLDRENVRLLTALVEICDEWFLDLYHTHASRALAEQAERPSVDSRRFRMLIEVGGIGPHEEDRWVDRTLRVGDAVLRGRGHVGRCVITNRDPESGEITLQTLKILGRYRRDVDTTEPVAFGIYGEILEPGTIRVGDAVEIDG